MQSTEETLEDLGWKAHFSEQVSAEEAERCYPVRVMAVHRGKIAVTGARSQGFMHVPELGRLGANISLQGSTALVRGVDGLRGAEVMDDVIHREKLVAGEPKHKAGLGHPLESVAAGDRASVS